MKRIAGLVLSFLIAAPLTAAAAPKISNQKARKLAIAATQKTFGEFVGQSKLHFRLDKRDKGTIRTFLIATDRINKQLMKGTTPIKFFGQGKINLRTGHVFQFGAG